MAETIVFKKCTECEDERPHGYFCKGENGENRLLLAVISVLMGRKVMETLSHAFEGQDVAALEQQMRDAGLPETALGTEEEDLAEAEVAIKEMWRLLDEQARLAEVATMLRDILPPGVRIAGIGLI